MKDDWLKKRKMVMWFCNQRACVWRPKVSFYLRNRANGINSFNCPVQGTNRDSRFGLWNVGVIIFNSVWFLLKKIIKSKFFLKKTETGSNRPVSVWFFRIKTDSNRFGSVFSVWLGFFCLGSVWFGFFGFLLIKPKPNQTG